MDHYSFQDSAQTGLFAIINLNYSAVKLFWNHENILSLEALMDHINQRQKQNLKRNIMELWKKILGMYHSLQYTAAFKTDCGESLYC